MNYEIAAWNCPTRSRYAPILRFIAASRSTWSEPMPACILIHKPGSLSVAIIWAVARNDIDIMANNSEYAP
jgi:hypothetical protein